MKIYMSSLKNSLIFTSFVWFILMVALAPSSFAQRTIYPDLNPSLKERMYFGGNMALQLGTLTFIEVSPLAGIMITEKFSTGLGSTYQYFNDRRFVGGNNHIYGGRIFARYNVFQKIFAYSEFESLNLDLFNQRSEQFNREWVPAFFVGGGYFTPTGNRGGVNFSLLYNLMHDNRRSPYNEPFVVRVGFLF
jgi:hypothetical protein